MASKILLARVAVLIALIMRFDDGVLALSNKSICNDTCKMLNVTPPYLDKIIDLMLDTGLATMELRSFFIFIRLTPEGRAIAESDAIPIVERKAANG